jgi:hypothetical protein
MTGCLMWRFFWGNAPVNEILGRYRRRDSTPRVAPAQGVIGCEEAMIALAIIESRYPELYGYVTSRRKFMYLLSAIKAFRDGDLHASKKYILVAIRNGLLLRGLALYLAMTLFGTYILRQLSLPPFGRSSIFTKLNLIFRRV